MKKSEIIVSLDIGTTKIAAIVGEKNQYGKIEILGLSKTESVGVIRGVVSNIEKTVNSIKKVVSDIEQEAEVSIGEVYVGIAGQHIKSLQHRGGIIRDTLDDEISQEDITTLRKNMFKLVMQPGEKIIDVIPQEYIIDKQQFTGEAIGIIGMAGISLEANFHIIVGKVAAAKNIERCIKRAGLEMSGMILEPIASAEAVLSKEEKDAGVVIVDIGGGTTDIAIFQDGIIRHTAVIPFGGNVITEDIKEGCSIIKTQAEALKIKFGSALAKENSDEEIVSIPGLRGRPPKEISLKNLSNIIQARAEEIIEYIYYEIKNSGYEKKLIAGIVLTGGGAQLKHIAQLTEFITGMDTRIGYPSEHLANNIPEKVINPMFSTGIGLIIKGFDYIEEQKKNLNKPGHKKNKSGGVIEKIRKWFDDDIN